MAASRQRRVIQTRVIITLVAVVLFVAPWPALPIFVTLHGGSKDVGMIIVPYMYISWFVALGAALLGTALTIISWRQLKQSCLLQVCLVANGLVVLMLMSMLGYIVSQIAA